MGSWPSIGRLISMSEYTVNPCMRGSFMTFFMCAFTVLLISAILASTS